MSQRFKKVLAEIVLAEMEPDEPWDERAFEGWMNGELCDVLHDMKSEGLIRYDEDEAGWVSVEKPKSIVDTFLSDMVGIASAPAGAASKGEESEVEKLQRQLREALVRERKLLDEVNRHSLNTAVLDGITAQLENYKKERTALEASEVAQRERSDG